MAGKTGIKIVKNDLSEHLKQFEHEYEKQHFIGMGKMALQLINNVVNGSQKEPVVPPILEGVLRSSGSVFVGSKFIAAGSPKTVTLTHLGMPNTEFDAPENTITVGFNTSYATRMHETDWNPGPVSQQSGDTGNKFLRKHLDSDMPELIDLYGAHIKKALFKE